MVEEISCWDAVEGDCRRREELSSQKKHKSDWEILEEPGSLGSCKTLLRRGPDLGQV